MTAALTPRVDLTGRTFGHLSVIELGADYVTAAGQRRARYVCRCDCGAETPVRASSLVTGRTRSCGHLRVAADPSYAAAHARIRVRRGPASAQTCACGKPAQQWAYRGGSVLEIRREVAGHSRGSSYTTTVSWSPEPNDYDPMCIPCHRTHDAALRSAA